MTSMYAEERQQAIAELARDHGRVSVADLSQRFDVTSETIRRDLDALASRGLLSRVHGGAVPAERIRLVESGVNARQSERASEKHRIAEAALALAAQRQALDDRVHPQVGAITHGHHGADVGQPDEAVARQFV